MEEYNGLKVKYDVYKVETGEPVIGCFVLRPTRDPAAIKALEAYANATENSELARDLRMWLYTLSLMGK